MPPAKQDWLRLRRLLSRLSALRNRHLLLMDIFILCLVPMLALGIRLDGWYSLRPYWAALLTYTLIALVVRIGLFYPFGLYHRYWRYATVDELAQTVLAVLTSNLLVCLFFFGWQGWGRPSTALPFSLPFLDGVLVLIFVGGTRFCIRLAHGSMRQPHRKDAQRVLIIGAGGAGQRIAKELQANPLLGLKPIGFVDDDPQKQRVRIANLPVLGKRDCLPEMVRRHSIDQVIIAMPSAPGKTIRAFLTLCEAAGVPTKTIPVVSAILRGMMRINPLRSVEIQDLFRREPIQTDIAAVRHLLAGKRVLITGGGGSIGSELCRQVLQCAPSEFALLGHGENSVFEVHNELQALLRQSSESASNGCTPPSLPRLQTFIADIRMPERIRSVLRDFKPEIVFHAAAHKHVPLMELNPTEAVSNNIFGTRNVLEAALEVGVDHFVLISTDKAVNPTSVMGASKRGAELLVLRAARQSGKAYVAVRFGNVLGSRGSVVPTFKRQIAAGGPVTVSHPEMTRYFMTIPEAVQLVLQAAVLGRGGEILMLDMGDPVKIIDLARDLIELSGLELGSDIDIVYTGIRPGEKLYEELFVSGEDYQPTHHEKIRIAANASAFVPVDLDATLAAMEQALAKDDQAGVVGCLQKLVPEFQPDKTRWDTPQEHARAVVATVERIRPAGGVRSGVSQNSYQNPL